MPKKKQTAWQKAFSAGFSGKKLELSKSDKQKSRASKLRAERRRKQQESRNRGY